MFPPLRIIKYMEESKEIYAKKYKSFQFPEEIDLSIVKKKFK